MTAPRLFTEPSTTTRPEDRSDDVQDGHYLDRPGRDLNRIHVFREDDLWATFIPAWRPESFEDGGVTHRLPYGVVTHETRRAAVDHVQAYLRSDDAKLDGEEMARLHAIGGHAYVRRLTEAPLHAGRIPLVTFAAARRGGRGHGA